MSVHDIVVFTDGAARRNPGPGGWAAIVATPEGQVTELGGGTGHTTNNRMELSGAIHALEHLRGQPGQVAIHTDSTYLIDGITKWIHGWRRKSWKTTSGGDVLNRDLWEQLATLVAERNPADRVSWHHVRGHAGVPGNERADEIATGFADEDSVPLYRGSLLAYPVPIHDRGPEGGEARPRREGARRATRAKAYSYLSLVDGKPMRHATWPECERRVKGASGARFKKSLSAADEAQILRSWGVEL